MLNGVKQVQVALAQDGDSWVGFNESAQLYGLAQPENEPSKGHKGQEFQQMSERIPGCNYEIIE